MKAIFAAVITATTAVSFAPTADAKGCIKGALVGGLVGHMAGHHGMAGAAAGCAIGHHHANKTEESKTNAETTEKK